MINIYRDCQELSASDESTSFKTQEPFDVLVNQRVSMGGKKIPQRRIKRILLEMCNLSAGRHILWFISKTLFTLPPLLYVLNMEGNEYVKESEWAQAAWPQLMHHNGNCADFSFIQMSLHPHPNTHIHVHICAHPWGRTALSVSPASCMCNSIFSNLNHSVSNAVCQEGGTLRIQSDGPQMICPELCRRVVFVAGTGEGHVLTSLSARVSAPCSITVQTIPAHNEILTYLSAYS